MPDDNGGNAGTSTATATGGSTTSTGTAADAATSYTAPQTQADLDRIVSERLARERSKFADYEDLKAKAAEHDKAVAANQTEAEKAKARADAAEAKAKLAESALLKYRVAEAKKVPAELLAGTTEEELNAHADRLLAYAGGKTTGTPSFDGGARTTADGGKSDMNTLIRRAAGLSS